MDVESNDAIAAGELGCEGARMRPSGLARRLHDGPIQRLCGVAAALGAPVPLSAGIRQRCKLEVEAAIADLRALITEGIAEDPVDEVPRTLAAAVRDAWSDSADPPAHLRYDGDAKLPAEQARLVRDFVAEALRNAGKHARASAAVSIHVEASDRKARVEVHNDGVLGAGEGRGTGLGLELLRAEAARHGGGVEAEPVGRDGFRAVLTLPFAAPMRTRRFERVRPSRVPEP